LLVNQGQYQGQY